MGQGVDKGNSKKGGTRGGVGKKDDRPRVDPARAAALRLLAGVRQGRTLAEQAGTPEFDPLARLAPPDRARAQRLALTTLRHSGRSDRLLGPLIQRKPRPEIRDLLRLSATEMLELGEAPHGVVNDAVELARRAGPKGRAAAGMVNAVLRRASSEGAVWADQPPQRMPGWLRRPVVAAWGEDTARAIEAAHQAGAPVDLTAKTEAPGEKLPTGSFRLRDAGQISALPGYDSGDWWVQDAAAALPARLLDAQPGERIADLCAAPGGKTLQLAAAGAQVTAVDLSGHRLSRLTENLTRCGLSAQVVEADILDWTPDAPFDAILLDAPCSATGTIRRHPDLPFCRDGSGIEELTALQSAMLDRALTLLRPGGRLVYATCSLLTAEGEDQLAAALDRHPGLVVDRPDLPGIDPAWITEQGGLRLRPDYWPDLGGMDGFFIARLRKP